MSDKTEAPTPKRIEEARKKGQVAKSQDLTTALSFLAVMSVVLIAGRGTAEALMEAMRGYFHDAFVIEEVGVQTAGQLLLRGGGQMLRAVLPFMAVALLVGVVASYAQVGSLFSFDSIQPKLEKIDPMKGFKNKFFSSKAYIELVKSLLKIAIIGLVLYFYLNSRIPLLGDLVKQPIVESWVSLGKLLAGLTFRVAFLMVVFGGADFFIQRWQHTKSLKMSKDEVKREYKDSEGDPHVKGERKHLYQEILAGGVQAGVKKATVVLVNPTHLAVALRYERGEGTAPEITAKGADEVAARIRELAKELNIPIERNVPLAQALYAIDEGKQIPEELYTAVAEILNVVFQRRDPA